MKWFFVLNFLTDYANTRLGNSIPSEKKGNISTIKRILSSFNPRPDNMRFYDFTDFFVQTR